MLRMLPSHAGAEKRIRTFSGGAPYWSETGTQRAVCGSSGFNGESKQTPHTAPKNRRMSAKLFNIQKKKPPWKNPTANRKLKRKFVGLISQSFICICNGRTFKQYIWNSKQIIKDYHKLHKNVIICILSFFSGIIVFKVDIQPGAPTTILPPTTTHDRTVKVMSETHARASEGWFLTVRHRPRVIGAHPS